MDPECDGCLVPPLLIQPLVENAIRHGIAPLVEGGAVRLDVHREGQAIEILLENPVDPFGHAAQAGAGLGLENVRLRLAKLFSGQAHVNVVSQRRPVPGAPSVPLHQTRRNPMKPLRIVIADDEDLARSLVTRIP